MSDIERKAFEQWLGDSRYALARPDVVEWFYDVWQAARQAPASGEVEPVAWVSSALYGSNLTFQKPAPPEGWEDYADDWYCYPLFTHPPAKVPEWMDEISENLKTQNNRITQDPLFVVFQKREIVVDEDFDHDRIAWGNPDGEADEEVQEKLNELYDDLDSDFFRSDDITLTDEDGTAEWRRVALKEVDEFVTCCFTEVGANDYLKANGHNLSRPHIYVTSLYRNEEMKRLREWLLTTPTPATTPETESCEWREDEGIWSGECGVSWWFEDGTPKENKQNFCPNCGKPCVQHEPQEQ